MECIHPRWPIGGGAFGGNDTNSEDPKGRPQLFRFQASHRPNSSANNIGAVTIDELETIVEHETLVLQIVTDNPNPVALLNTPCKLLGKHV